MKCYIGLDVSSLKLDACFINEDKEILFEASFPNDINGAQNIKDKILELHQDFSFQKLVIGMESTSMYHFHPSMFFFADDDLNQLNLSVTVENPFRIKQFSKMFDTDKTDKIDARIIADFLRAELYTVNPVKQDNYIALQRLTRTRYQLVCQMTQAKQHFLENLTYKCNTLSRELASSDVSTSIFGSTMITLLTEEMTLDEFAMLELEEAGQYLQKLGKGRFKDPEKLAMAIKKAVRDSYRLSKVTSDSVDLVLAVIANEIKMLKKQIKTLEKAIEDLLDVIPEATCLKSIPGIGSVYAAGLLAEIGQIDRFKDQAALAKYAGLVWKKNQSGNFSAENTPLSRSANRYFRYYLVEATNHVRMYAPEFREYYQAKKKEVPKHQHKRALVLTARKFVRLVDVLLRNGQIYLPQKGGID